jgi:FtsP/CotA-like multicopper oxidase with cupredoxin domain
MMDIVAANTVYWYLRDTVESTSNAVIKQTLTLDYPDEHPFHIYINDFQVMSVNGQLYNAHGLQDTVVVPAHGEVVIRIRLRISRGNSYTIVMFCFMETVV